MSLSKDTSQSVLSYQQNTMPVPEAAYTYSDQIKMNGTVPYQDLILYTGYVTHCKQKTYTCYDAKHTQDLGMVYKVFTPGT